MKDRNVKNKILFVLICTMIIGAMTLIVINFNGIINYFSGVIDILMPFIYGAIIAYLLTPVCNKLDTKLSKDKNNVKQSKLSILLSEMLMIIIIALILLLLIPNLAESSKNIAASLPGSIKSANEGINKFIAKNPIMHNIVGENVLNLEKIFGDFLKDSVLNNANNIATNLALGTKQVIDVTIDIIVGVIASILMLANRKEFARQTNKLLKALMKDKTSEFIIKEVKMANNKFSGFFIGKIIDSLIIGIICFISLLILKMPYVGLVSVIVGVTNIIPFVGPFIGAVPGAIIIFSVSPIKSLYFLIFILILQQLDGSIIGPKCIGSATGLNTFWVLFAIMFFGGLWGVVGLLIGVPLFAVIYDIVKNYINFRLENKNKDLTK